MDANYSDPEALTVLSSTINQTLIETGRFFRSKGSMQSRAQLKRTMPTSREQFNLALDDLSEQIFMAKAFLERDYEAVRAKKMVSRQPQPTEDVVMGEAEIKPEPEPEQEKAQEEEAEPRPDPEAELELKPPVPEAADVKREEDHGEAVKAEAKPIDQEQQIADEKPMTQSEGIDVAAAGAGEPEINFDSVLNDSAGGPNDFDLSLDFGDDLGNQNFLGVGSGSGGEEQGKEPQDMEVRGDSTTATGMGGDAFDMELQKTGETGATEGLPEGNDEGAGEMMGQSSFDDLFMEHDSMEGNLLEGDGLMNLKELDELDDSWFT